MALSWDSGSGRCGVWSQILLSVVYISLRTVLAQAFALLVAVLQAPSGLHN
ncbi:MAG: hypothetical protein K6T86_15715 [Pirellulales bacterium]|nr:hypothetical protein [Pirellulales bacterium]